MSFSVIRPHTTGISGTYHNPDLVSYVGGITSHAPLPDASNYHMFHPPRQYVEEVFWPDELGIMQTSHAVLQIHSYQWRQPTMDIGRLSNLQ
jgi:hypothetical protein